MVNNAVTIGRMVSAGSSEHEVRFAASVHSQPIELRVPRRLWQKAINDGDGPSDGVVFRMPKNAYRLIESEAGLQILMGNCPVASVMSLR